MIQLILSETFRYLQLFELWPNKNLFIYLFILHGMKPVIINMWQVWKNTPRKYLFQHHNRFLRRIFKLRTLSFSKITRQNSFPLWGLFLLLFFFFFLFAVLYFFNALFKRDDLFPFNVSKRSRIVHKHFLLKFSSFHQISISVIF